MTEKMHCICPTCISKVALLGRDHYLLFVNAFSGYFDYEYFILEDAISQNDKIAKAIRQLELRGYVLSSEISKHTICLMPNFDGTHYTQSTDEHCWCAKCKHN